MGFLDVANLCTIEMQVCYFVDAAGMPRLLRSTILALACALAGTHQANGSRAWLPGNDISIEATSRRSLSGGWPVITTGLLFNFVKGVCT